VTQIGSTQAPFRADTRTVLDRLGGWRGLIDGAAPPAVFAATNAGVRLTGSVEQALPVAVAAAIGTAAGLGMWRAAHGHSVAGLLRGLVGLVVAVGLALWTGQARDFFLPGIYVDAFYAVALAASALIGRPLIGHAYATLFRVGRSWAVNRRLLRVLTLATWGWAGVYLLRAVVQGLLYSADQPELLAVAKLTLGWPLTAAAVVVTLAAVRRNRGNGGRAS